MTLYHLEGAEEFLPAPHTSTIKRDCKKKKGKNLKKCLKLAFFSALPIQSAVLKKPKYLRTNELENLDLKFYLTAPKQDGSSRIEKYAPTLPAASAEKYLRNQRFVSPTADH